MNNMKKYVLWIFEFQTCLEDAVDSQELFFFYQPSGFSAAAWSHLTGKFMRLEINKTINSLSSDVSVIG